VLLYDGWLRAYVADSSLAAGAGGCFPGSATVRLESGETRAMHGLTVGDRVLTYDLTTRQFHFDPVVAFLHRSPRAADTRYVSVHTDRRHRLTLTPGTCACAVRSVVSVRLFVSTPSLEPTGL